MRRLFTMFLRKNEVKYIPLKKKNILKVMTFTCNKKAKLFEFF